MDSLSEKEGFKVVTVDIDKMLSTEWYGNKPTEGSITKLPYGSGEFSNKYTQAKDFIKKTQGKDIEMPHITGFLKDGSILNLEGKHRFLVFKDMGAKQMNIAVPKNTDMSADWIISQPQGGKVEKGQSGKQIVSADEGSKILQEATEDTFNSILKEARKTGVARVDLDGGNWLAFHKSAKEPGRWQLTEFNKDDLPLSDTQFTDPNDAIKEMTQLAPLRKDLPDSIGFGLEKGEYTHKYKLRLRPIGPGTIPKNGFIEAESERVAIFDRPLTRQELSDFEMEPIGFKKINNKKGK